MLLGKGRVERLPFYRGIPQIPQKIGANDGAGEGEQHPLLLAQFSFLPDLLLSQSQVLLRCTLGYLYGASSERMPDYGE